MGKRGTSGDKRGSSGDKRKKMTSRKTSARRSAGRRKQRPVFPVGDIHHAFCGDEPIEKVEPQAALFLAAVETYVAHEILELACNHAASRGSTEITSSDFISVVQNDEELGHIFGDVIDNELNEMREKKEAKEKKAKEAMEKKQKRKKVKAKSPENGITE